MEHFKDLGLEKQNGIYIANSDNFKKFKEEKFDKGWDKEKGYLFMLYSYSRFPFFWGIPSPKKELVAKSKKFRIKGGTMVLEGAGDQTGMGMSDGTIITNYNRDMCGFYDKGGMIIVNKSKTHTGFRMKGGTIFVNDSEDMLGFEMEKGTVIVSNLVEAKRRAGRFKSKRELAGFRMKGGMILGNNLGNKVGSEMHGGTIIANTVENFNAYKMFNGTIIVKNGGNSNCEIMYYGTVIVNTTEMHNFSGMEGGTFFGREVESMHWMHYPRFNAIIIAGEIENIPDFYVSKRDEGEVEMLITNGDGLIIKGDALGNIIENTVDEIMKKLPEKLFIKSGDRYCIKPLEKVFSYKKAETGKDAYDFHKQSKIKQLYTAYQNKLENKLEIWKRKKEDVPIILSKELAEAITEVKKIKEDCNKLSSFIDTEFKVFVKQKVLEMKMDILKLLKEKKPETIQEIRKRDKAVTYPKEKVWETAFKTFGLDY